MEHSLIVRCSDCGNLAKRTYTHAENALVTTECSHCDYYMVVYLDSAEVIEAHTSCTAIFSPSRATLIPIVKHIQPNLRSSFNLSA